MKHKLRNKQNDMRDDISETRDIVEIATTSLAAEQANKGLKSRSTYLVKRE